MEGNVFEVLLSIKKMKSEKDYRESQLTVIVATICALLNSDGGELNIEFEDNAILRNETDDILRMIEQRLVDIIGSCVFHAKVKILKKNAKQLVFTVASSQSLCTVNYHLYLPTPSQVIPISPLEPPESVKAILNRELRNEKQIENYEDFVLNRQVPFEEFDSIQFKQLKSEKSKCVSLVDRMTNKSNKLERYISGFANKNGGRIFYGINDDGTVQGEAIGEKDEEEIIRKVTKTINQLIWPGGKLERGRHWEIQFAPVKDENQNEIPSLFVIIISVVPLRGGLFIQEPESYHVVQSRLVRMSFTEWRCRFFVDEQSSAVMDMVPSVVGRARWSSVRTQKICCQILQSLVKYQNDGDHYGFEKFATFAEERYQDTEVQLIILGERSQHAYKTGQFKKAESLIAEYENVSSQEPTLKDCLVFELRKAYAKSAISRAKGDYQESYDIAREGLQLAEMAPAGILTASFYNHVAIVEKRLSQQTKEEAKRAVLVQSARHHHIEALQHIEASSVEQEFSITIADLQQRIHIFRAITILGDFGNGANFRKATPPDIKDAQTDLSIYDRLILEGYKETKYRKTYHLFSLSDLRMGRWWQQQKQQRQEKRSLENYKIPALLKEAFDYAKEAKIISMESHFEELTNYANNRLAIIIETMIKLNVSSIRLPNRLRND